MSVTFDVIKNLVHETELFLLGRETSERKTLFNCWRRSQIIDSPISVPY